MRSPVITVPAVTRPVPGKGGGHAGGDWPPPPTPKLCCAFASGRPILSHEWVSGKLDALGDERRETLGLGFGEVQVIGDPSLLAGEADGEPAVPAPNVGTV
jgi:hypothetical protein